MSLRRLLRQFVKSKLLAFRAAVTVTHTYCYLPLARALRLSVTIFDNLTLLQLIVISVILGVFAVVFGVFLYALWCSF